VASRRHVVTRTSYRAVPSIVSMAPITDTPWCLAVIADERISREWLLRALALGLSLFVIHIGLMLLACVALGKAFKPTAYPGEVGGTWYWPAREHKTYLEIFGILAGIGIVLLLLILVGSTGKLVVGALSTAVVVPVVIRSYLQKTPTTTSRADSQALKTYDWAVFAAALVIAVIPAAAFFTASIHECEISRIEEEQVAFARSMSDRHRALFDFYQGVRMAPIVRSKLAGMLCPPSNSGFPSGCYALPGWTW